MGQDYVGKIVVGYQRPQGFNIGGEIRKLPEKLRELMGAIEDSENNTHDKINNITNEITEEMSNVSGDHEFQVHYHNRVLMEGQYCLGVEIACNLVMGAINLEGLQSEAAEISNILEEVLDKKPEVILMGQLS